MGSVRMTVRLSFSVFGVAQPKGSARAFLPKGWTRPIITSDNPSLKAWEGLVRGELQRVMADVDATSKAMLFDAPISVTLAFYLPRPKSAPRKVIYPTKRPDLDKCIRSTIDALSGVAFKDDTQVVSIAATKHYADGAARVDIVVEPFTPPLFEAAGLPARNESLDL